MKAKISLSGEGIQQFFAQNGEKLVLGATILALFGFLYSAITAKPLDETQSPRAIQDASNRLTATLQEPNWDSVRSTIPDLTSTNIDEKIKISMDEVSIARVEQTQPWNPPLFEAPAKRADPEIYAVEKLQIAAARAIVPYAPPQIQPDMAVEAAPVPAPPPPRLADNARRGVASELEGGAAAVVPQSVRIPPYAQLPGVRIPQADPKKKSYAIITGIIPEEKQADEYRRKFANALQDPQRPMQQGVGDYPHYYYFNVERAEVKDAKQNDFKWVPVLSKSNYLSTASEIKNWALPQQSLEIVDTNYVFQPEPLPARPDRPDSYTYMTWPLPPLFLKNWGFEAAHPKVPLFKPLTDSIQVQPDQPQNLDLENAQIGPTGAGAPPGAMVGPGGGMQRYPMERDTVPVMPGRGGYGGNFPRGEYNEGGAWGATPQMPMVPHKLFRFIDLTAEPGKTYRYRVQLVLHNPNHGIAPMYLEKPESGDIKKLTVSSAWSEPTAPVTIPRDYQILAESVTVPGGRLADLKAKVSVLAMVKAPASESQYNVPTTAGREVWLEAKKTIDDVLLGGIVTFKDQTIENVLDLTADEVRKIEKVTIDTDQTMLLDVRSDDALGIPSSKLKGPTQMLLIDNTGRLTIASSAADSLVAKDFTDRTYFPPESAPGAFDTEGFGPGRAGGFPRPGPPPGRSPYGPPAGSRGRGATRE